MEAGDPSSRQSAFTPTSSHPDRFDQRPRDPHQRPTYREAPAMATALISPSTPYGAHPPSFSSSYAPSGPGTASIAGMISPVESRRTSDDNESGLKATSLPSISEVIGNKPSPYQPSSMAGQSSYQHPPPYLSSAPPHPRPYSDMGPDRHPSPRSMGPSSSSAAPPGPFPRDGPGPAFSDRPPYSGRAAPPPPLNTYAGGHHTHPSPPVKTDHHHEFEHRNSEPSRLNGSSPYGSHPPSAHQQQQQQPPMPYSAPPTGHLPPGQLPLSAYPVSPRHTGPPHMPSPYEQQHPSSAHPHHRSSMHGGGPEEGGPDGYGGPRRYDSTLTRHFEAWGYQDGLARVSDHPNQHHHGSASSASSSGSGDGGGGGRDGSGGSRGAGGWMPPPDEEDGDHPSYSPYRHAHGHHHPSSPYHVQLEPGHRFDVFTANRLAQVASSARTIFTFADAYTKLAQEQQHSHPIPDRLPTDRELVDMLSSVESIRRSLVQVQEVVAQSISNNDRMNPDHQHKPRGPYEDEDAHMYDGMKPAYGMGEVKKRRGRAAPPGRCHSCNRIDTPEWRRGPDGARTLCNACGLHYAKLERKRLLESRSLRPKPVDDRA